MKQNLKFLFVYLIFQSIVLVSGCGQTGPLYLPPDDLPPNNSGKTK